MVEETTLLDVYPELRVGPAGISLSLYAEWSDGTVSVEDETWYTHDELQDAREVVSLHTTSETRDAIQPSDDQDDRWVDKISVGDRMEDKSRPAWWSDSALVEVTGKTGIRADNYVIDDNPSGDKTVADVNPDYPASNKVVLARYVSGSDKEYAFPTSRLKHPEAFDSKKSTHYNEKRH